MQILDYAAFAARHLQRARDYVAQHGDEVLAHALAKAWGDVDLALDMPAEFAAFYADVT